MNGFNLSNIQDARLGGTQLSAIYLGSSKLWPTAFDYSQEYLTIESLADNNTISWWLSDGNYGTNKTIEWSTDKTNWTSVTSHYTSPGRTITTLNTGDKIYLKGTNTQLASSSAYCCFKSTSTFKVYGNIMSLLYGNNFTDKITFPNSANYVFYRLFYGSKVVDASNLILSATTLVPHCYRGMFHGCTSLTAVPTSLPATTLATDCYREIYQACTSLITVPSAMLPAKTLATNCYRSMFYNCTGLTNSPGLYATTLAESCYSRMFYGCSSLTDAPAILPATTLATDCYSYMFRSCSSLTDAPVLPATTLVTTCYQYMFNQCTSLSYVKAMFITIPNSTMVNNWLNNVASKGIFVKNTNATWTSTGPSGVPSGWTVQRASS